jgi:hypothetical protein
MPPAENAIAAKVSISNAIGPIYGSNLARFQYKRSLLANITHIVLTYNRIF